MNIALFAQHGYSREPGISHSGAHTTVCIEACSKPLRASLPRGVFIPIVDWRKIAAAIKLLQ